jgi:hypothetical protein
MADDLELEMGHALSGSVYELSNESRAHHFTIRGYAASRPTVTGGWPEPGLDCLVWRGARILRRP